MVRKLASVLISLAAISPTWVHALGLGEIQLNSFLNQPLDAKIEILSSTRGEADGLQVKLASPEAFERSGLEFSNHLRDLKFTVTTDSNGKKYIKVTTRKSFREPFLNFLLEVNWASGRILREYAELVDPPSLVRSSPSSTQNTVTSAPPVRQTTAPRSTSQAPQPPLYGSSRTESSSGFIGDTYRTKRNDTAWQIANGARPDNQVTVEQSMMAILRANPEAFIRQNINRLKAGYTLSIPDKDTMLSQSHSEALAEVRRQTREWRNRGKSTSTAQSTTKGRLEILPPQTDSNGQEQAGGVSGEGNEKLHREVMLAKEATEAQRQENAELRLRVSELEEQINNANKLATLKADQLAALEKKLKELNAAEEQTPVVPTEDTPVEAETPETTEPEAAEVPEEPAQEETTPATYQPVVEAVAAKPGTPINQHIVEGFKPVDLAALPKSELPANPFKTGSGVAGATSVAAGTEMGLIDKAIAYFKANPVIKWIVGGAIGILVIILGMMFARRGSSDDEFEESILHEQGLEESSALEETVTMAADNSENLFDPMDDEDSVTADKQDVTDTSFLNDMVLSDMSNIEGEGSGSDPLTEADVFLAYGRFGPAENMIKSAIEKEPARNDLRLKLLEIYYSSKNKDAFEQEATAFSADLQNNPDPDTWEKVVEMGEDLCPSNSLFAMAGAGAAGAAAAGAAAAMDNSLEDSASVKAVDEEDTEIMDFDLSEFEEQIDSMEADKLENPSASMPEEGGELDLDLDDLMADVEDGKQENTMEITTELEDIADVLNPDTEETKPQDDVTAEFASDVIPLRPEITQEMDIPDLDYASDETLPMDEDLDMDDDALAEIDEVGTKLDLARAYIDMGDPEGAKSILQEVMEEGNDGQKGEAKELLAQI